MNQEDKKLAPDFAIGYMVSLFENAAEITVALTQTQSEEDIIGVIANKISSLKNYAHFLGCDGNYKEAESTLSEIARLERLVEAIKFVVAHKNAERQDG